MTEWTKTLLFVVAAAVTFGLATIAQTLSRPTAAKEFERVGESFYPEFEDPTTARSLQVVTYDEDTTTIKPFDVTWGKEGWTISPYGYPADAADQLQKTAASVIGIDREALASRREADHEIYGVVDPLSNDLTKLKGRGSRITLKNEQDEVLADYIIGKPVEGLDGYFYVRRPKEKETYRAAIDLNLSTRFADWIESDLLGLSASDLREVQILDYSVDTDRGTIANRDESLLSREENFGPWTLAGIDDATEQINTSAVNGLTRVLDELKIIGVRPKPKGLNADLSLDGAVINNQLAFELLRQSLDDKGFFLASDREGNLQLVAQEGRVVAKTSEGIDYDLYFGEQFTGSLYELEFGDAEESTAPQQLKEEEGEKKSETGRYVFIAARFDAEALGEPPVPPADSTKPAASTGEAGPETDDKGGESVQADVPDKEEAATEESEEARKAQADYEAAKKEYDTKVADAREKVAELNERFGEWYYVISTENFEDLRLSRNELITPKSETDTEPATDGTGSDASTSEAGSPVEAPRPAPSTGNEASPAQKSET